MLAKLSVHNYALIKELDIELENGLTIITGETGAGKSILLGALSLILGTRADTSVLLEKDEKCIVEGIFKIDDYDLEDFFKSNDLDYESVTTLRREINPAGKSRAFINDTPVTINLLREIGDRLIDIHSQHQTLMLHDNSFQINLIDSFAGTTGMLAGYRSAYTAYRSHLREYNEVKDQSEKNRSDLEYYTFQLNQLEEAKLREGEQEELEREQEILGHAGEIKLALVNTSELLSTSDQSVLVQLKEVLANINRIRGFLPETENIIQRIDSTYIELHDIAGEAEKLSGSIEADPRRLETVSERLDTLYSLIKKHRAADLNELLVRKNEIKGKIDAISTSSERLGELELLIGKETTDLKKISAGISGKRIKVLPEIEKRITEMLKHLGMPNARFRILLSPTREFTPNGTDAADFLFSANKQIEPENLAKIASGGELSRVMLSLKSLLTKNNNLPTIIFDEIDSGVSGEVADKVGQILSGMGRYMQVVNITHLPQVASRGTKHYHVFKDDSGDSTVTRVKLLSADERIFEVARLLSGSAVTETAIKNARELLQAANN